MLKRKGLGFRALVTMAVTMITVTVLAATWTTGLVNDTLTQGQNKIENQQNTLSGQIQIKNKETLADAARYVWDRATECSKVKKQNKKGGYPGLKDTYLGKKPKCSGMSVLNPTDPVKAITGSGNDMEGKFSKIKFQIKKPIKLNSTTQYGNPDPQGNKFTYITTAQKHEYYQITTAQCNSVKEDGKFFPPFPTRQQSSQKPYAYIITSSTDGSKRVTATKSSWTWEQFKQKYSQGQLQQTPQGIYCNKNAEGRPLVGTIKGPINELFKRNSMEGSVTLQLCPGDKGFIQVNKKKPQNDGEVSDSIGGTTYEKRFGFIQLTSLGESCSGGSAKPAPPDIPPSATTSGSILRVEVNVDNYPKTGERFRLYDERTHIGTGSRAPVLTPPNDKNLCKLSLREVDSFATIGTYHDDGRVLFNQGAKIERNGVFPDKDSNSIVRTNWQIDYRDGENKRGELLAEDLYDELMSTGFTNDRIAREFKLLEDSKEEGKDLFNLYGDMICGTSNGAARAKWHVCSDDREGMEVSVNSQTWICQDNNWKKR
ncbi:MAG: hypothetical protein ABEJ95_03930 [Candidatus Nanohalobium sp.]